MTAPVACAPPLPALHAAFLALVPQIERHGRIHLRGLKSGDALEEAIAEMVALAWKWHLRLVARGKDPGRFPSAIASYAARAVWSGRGVCGQAKSTDVLSSAAQVRRGFTVRSLPACGSLRDSPFEHALADRTVSAVDEQVAFRMDFLRWLSMLSSRDRHMVIDLMAGASTRHVADKYGLSCNRILQKRAQFRDHRRRFREWSGAGRRGACGSRKPCRPPGSMPNGPAA